MKNAITVGLGGAAGALLRAAVFEAVPAAGLWTVNVFGSLLLGLFAVLLAEKREVRLFLATGLLGSFTTFSAFSAEWFAMLDKSAAAGLVYAVLMTAASVAAAGAGVWIGRKLRND